MQVGDRVRIKSGQPHEGRTGTVIEIRHQLKRFATAVIDLDATAEKPKMDIVLLEHWLKPEATK